MQSIFSHTHTANKKKLNSREIDWNLISALLSVRYSFVHIQNVNIVNVSISEKLSHKLNNQLHFAVFFFYFGTKAISRYQKRPRIKMKLEKKCIKLNVENCRDRQSTSKKTKPDQIVLSMK